MSILLADVSISAKDVGAPSVSLNGLPGIFLGTLLTFAGALSVIFVIVGALKYVTSAGDPKRLTSARETITYALVGVAISAAAFIIVSYVLNAIKL